MDDHLAFRRNRKFSINRNTGLPRPARRFSLGEPGYTGTRQVNKNLLVEIIAYSPVSESSSQAHRDFRAAHEGYYESQC